MSEEKIVFLDRDGTINVDFGYVFEVHRLELIKGASSAIARLKKAGFRVVIVTNQSAVGRGMASAEEVEETNHALLGMLLAEDSAAVVDQIVCCPHAPESACYCRKPQIGLLKQVEEKFLFHAEDCWIVGDKMSDVAFGENAGIPHQHCLLVLSGQGSQQLDALKAESKPLPRYCEDIDAAVSLILDN